ncbi:MAG: response regulator transcription factor [Elusimicrobia bacterium]|nr:response regulator transcription factor [Elusimicrobiota bacterium]
MTGKATILLVDDDPAITEVLEPALTDAGYTVRTATDANQAFSVLAEDMVDVMVLDIQLPGISGLKLLKLIKEDPKTAGVAVLMLTLRKSESDKVTGLDTGADDYVAKPFSVKEVLARVGALIRRSRHAGQTARVLEAAGIRIDFDAFEVVVGKRKADLRPMEFALLARLMQHAGQVLTYRILSEALSEGSRIITSETLYAHVKNLRQKLGSAGDRIETIYGIGYKFKGD